MRTRMSVLSVLAFTLACDVLSPSVDFRHATATFMCGPADGGATAITLSPEPIPATEPTYPYVQITILEQLSALSGHTFVVGRNGTAWASYVTGLGVFEDVSTGKLSIGAVDPDSTVHGEVNLRFGSRRVVRAFRAEWINTKPTVLCG